LTPSDERQRQSGISIACYLFNMAARAQDAMSSSPSRERPGTGPRSDPDHVSEGEREAWRRRLDELRAEAESLCREAETLLRKRNGPM
jgi:hypothetical protein